MIRSLVLGLAAMIALASHAEAGRNAGGALIVHTNDSVTYTTTGSYCGVDFDDPGSCENANTRTDKDENTPAVIWFLAAFPSGSDPAVTGIQFGVDFNMPAGQGYVGASGPCGPNPQLLPTEGFPDTPGGALLGYGEAVADTLFPFFWLAAYGIDETSYFGTAEYPGGRAKFADDSVPPGEDAIEKFGTVRWYSTGTNECPTAGGGDSDGGGGGGGADDSPENPGDEAEGDHGVESDGESMWVANQVLACLRPDFPIPPIGPVSQLGIPAFDGLASQLSVTSVRRLLPQNEGWLSQFPTGSHIIVIGFGANTDEAEAARLFRQLPGVAWAQPNAVATGDVFTPSDTYIETQWYLNQVPFEDWINCPPELQLVPCCDECDIGIDTAWQYTRGDSTVHVAFFDVGADLVQPDLKDVYMLNPHRGEDPSNWEDRNGNGRADFCPFELGGDLDGEDNDGNGIVDDVLLGWHIHLEITEWSHVWEHKRTPHGTSVAGVLGARSDNAIGIASVAGGTPLSPGVRLIQYSFVGTPSEGFDLASQVQSFYDARSHGARIYSSSTNLIVGLTCCFPDGHCENLTEQECAEAGGTWTGVPDVVTELSASMLFVQAAGNSNTTPMTSDFAKLPGVMAVGGYWCQDGGRWHIPGPAWPEGHQWPPNWIGSDYGPELSVVGPTDDHDTRGWDYVQTVMGATKQTSQPFCNPGFEDPIACFGGTSAAGPIVASVAALIYSYSDQHDLGLTPAQVRKIIERTAEDIQCDSVVVGCECDNPDPDPDCGDRLLGWDMYSGYGRVDAGRAFSLPVAALELSPHSSYLVPGETALLQWEYIDILGNEPLRFELHYWLSDGNSWQVLDDAVPATDRRYVWYVPVDFPTTGYGYVRLTVVDTAMPNRVNHDFRRFALQGYAETAGAMEKGELPKLSVRPNPTSGAAVVLYALEKSADVSLRVFDASGRCIRTLVKAKQPRGPKMAEWDKMDEQGHPVASGVYFVRLETGRGSRCTRLVQIQ